MDKEVSGKEAVPNVNQTSALDNTPIDYNDYNYNYMEYNDNIYNGYSDYNDYIDKTLLLLASNPKDLKD